MYKYNLVIQTFKQCLDHLNQERIAGDQLADTGFERSGRHLPQHQAKGLECAADLVGNVPMHGHQPGTGPTTFG